MTAPAVRRRGAADSAVVLGDPPLTWPGAAAAVFAIGLVAAGAASITGNGRWSVPAGATGVILAMLVGLAGARNRERAFLVRGLVLALAPSLGLRMPTFEAVQVRRWTGFWPGVPTRIVLRYGHAAPTAGPAWMVEPVSVLERELDAKYRVVGHRTRRRRLLIARYTPDMVPERLPEVIRADKVLHDIFGATANVDIATHGERLVTIDVTHALGPKVARAAVRASIEQTLTALLPGRWRAHWKLTEDEVRFEVRPVMPTSVSRRAAPVTDETLNRIPLAVDEDGHDVEWALKGSGPHLLVVGKTGTGKTVAINGVVLESARRNWPVWIVDPKRIEFMALRTWPNVQIVATTVEDQIAVIFHAHEQMERRYAQIESGGDESDFEPLVVVLDEYRNFVRLVTAWWAAIKVKGMPAKCPVFEWVAAIAEKGRSGRVHLVLGTQRPDADFLTGSMRDNFDSRLALGRLSPQGAQMMWESPYLGVSTPRKIGGRGTGITADERVEEVQVLWTPDPRRALRDKKQADLAILEALRPAEVRHRPLQVELGPEKDIDGKEIAHWTRVLESQLVVTDHACAPTLELSVNRATREVVVDEPDDQDDEPATSEAGDEQAFDGFDGYGPEQLTHAARLDAGDLICIDDVLDAWAVVEAIDIDEGDDDLARVSWRDDDGMAGDLELPGDDSIRVRRPADDLEEP